MPFQNFTDQFAFIFVGVDWNLLFWNSSSGQSRTDSSPFWPLQNHAVSKLSDGSILVTDNNTYDQYHFKPKTPLMEPVDEQGVRKGTKQLAGHYGVMPGPMINHSSTALPNGRALVCGGTRTGQVLSSCLTYSSVLLPAGVWRGVWANATSMLAKRSCRFGMVSDGRFAYAVGGCDENGASLASAERYDARTGEWERIKPMPHSRQFFSLLSVANHTRLYAIGGNDTEGAMTSVDIYDIASDTWSSGPELRKLRNGLSAAVTPDDTIWVFGGEDKSVEILPLDAWRWLPWHYHTLPRAVKDARVVSV